MLGIKQIFRKEEPTGTCPICDVAYKRVKRDLRADCFDASYVITAWTLLCPECGYTLILPGMAKIRPASSVTQEERSEGREIPVAVSKMDEADEPKADGTDVVKAEEKAPEAPEAAEKAEPEAPAVTAAQEKSKAASVPEPPAKPAGKPAETISGKPESQPAVLPVKAEKKAPAAAKPADTGTGTGSAPKPAEKQDAAGNNASAGAEPKRSDKAEQKDEGSAKPAQSGTQKAPEQSGDTPQEKKLADASEPRNVEKRGGEVGTKQAKSEAKTAAQKADGKDSRQDKPKAEKPAPGRRTPAPQPKAQPQPQPRPSPKMGSMGQGVHPTPPFGANRMNSGFSAGSAFPTSALSNLDSLKAFVQEQEAEKANAEKANGGMRTPNQAQAQPRKPAQGPGSAKAGNAVAKPQERPEKKDAGTAAVKQEKPAGTAAPALTAEADKNPLSAEKKDRGPADKKSSEPASQADAKSSEKSLSAKNDGGTKVSGHGEEPAKAEDKKAPAEPSAESKEQKEKDQKDAKDSKKEGKAEQQEPAADAAATETGKPAESQEALAEEASAGGEAQSKGAKAQAMAAAQKLQEKLPPDLAEKIPVISTIAKQQKHALFISEEKRYLETHVPHTQFIINDLVYDTENSEMFLRIDGQYGLDRPCVHYNYRTKNGNFFRCTVKYKHEDSIRALDEFEAKRMLEKYPDLYRKFFPDSVSDA